VLLSYLLLSPCQDWPAAAYLQLSSVSSKYEL
jgi:hypothetical protein